MQSCKSEEESLAGLYSSEGLSVRLDINNFDTHSTKASIDPANDQWSNKSFSEDDVVGFFSSHGNSNVNDGEGALINVPLTYQGSDIFKNPEVQLDPVDMNSGETFIYFPFDENIVYQADSDSPDMDAGLGLRLDGGPSPEILKCLDFLTPMELNVNNYGATGTFAIYGKMHHSFSELIIMRGEGFDNPKEGQEDIIVALQNGYSHIRINLTESPWNCSTQLVYNPDYDMTEEECKLWQAWKGGNYGITITDPDGREAWYVVLPTIGNGNMRSTVDYIQLYDNDGFLQTVTSIPLAKDGNTITKRLNEGVRYPIEITMKELVPNVNPYPVMPWNPDVDITDSRTRGINNLTEFSFWKQYYQGYLSNGIYVDELMNYGDVYKDSEGNIVYWHFYILDDLDFSQYSDGTNGPIIPELRDIIDGVSTELDNHLFLNHSISQTSSPFVGNLNGQYAAVQNLDFINPYIISVSNQPVGAIANTANSSKISNCSVDMGTIYTQGPVGMAVGDITGGEVSGCNFTGFVAGSTSYSLEPKYIFGNAPSPTTVVSDNISSVEYSLNN